MEDVVFIFIVGILLVMFIATLTSGRRRSTSHINDTTNGSNLIYFGSEDTHRSHHHGHDDHSTSFDCSSGDSSSSDSGGCDGGGCGGGGCD